VEALVRAGLRNPVKVCVFFVVVKERRLSSSQIIFSFLFFKVCVRVQGLVGLGKQAIPSTLTIEYMVGSYKGTGRQSSYKTRLFFPPQLLP
jgi:hypothetical protein